MDEDLKQYLDAKFAEVDSKFTEVGAKFAEVDSKFAEVRADAEAMEGRLRTQIQSAEDRSAALIAAEMGSLHNEIRAVLDYGKKTGANVTTCLEMIVRQSRWHDETDNKAMELLMRVNSMEKRLLDLEGGKAA
jgi:hypothetical protein